MSYAGAFITLLNKVPNPFDAVKLTGDLKYVHSWDIAFYMFKNEWCILIIKRQNIVFLMLI